MAKDFNQAIVMGNLTRDPEMRTTPSGQNVTSFSVATNRSWQDQSGEKKDAVEYHNIVAWGKLAELVDSYLKKGRKVLVSGRLQTRNWDAEDGSKRQRTEIVANDINFIGGQSEGGDYAPDIPADMPQEAGSNADTKKAKKDDTPPVDDLGDGEINLDDIPF
ncbi:MAG: single-stranded DNA-binding protein [Patescibacteria group bacterium]|jgi:single-strand DNA-binding protein|nr:single-stranded DNA-binding protein [Patescibacteria group bacterium]